MSLIYETEDLRIRPYGGTIIHGERARCQTRDVGIVGTKVKMREAVRAEQINREDRSPTVLSAEVKGDAVRAEGIKGTRDERDTRSGRR